MAVQKTIMENPSIEELLLSSETLHKRDYFTRQEEQDKSMLFEKIAADIFKIPVYELFYNTRRREIVIPRQLCMWWMKKTTTWSLANIGARYGRDHATVINARRSINNIIETNDMRWLDDINLFIKTMKDHD